MFSGFHCLFDKKIIFQKIKLSYLVVGHTHEDVDSYFSLISRFFKYVQDLKEVCTIPDFSCDLQRSCEIPAKCVETT